VRELYNSWPLFGRVNCWQRGKKRFQRTRLNDDGEYPRLGWTRASVIACGSSIGASAFDEVLGNTLSYGSNLCTRCQSFILQKQIEIKMMCARPSTMDLLR